MTDTPIYADLYSETDPYTRRLLENTSDGADQ